MGLTTFALGFRSRKAAARWRFSFGWGVGVAVAILVAACAGASPLEAAASEQTYISDLAQFSNPHYGATVKPRSIKFYTGVYLERLHWRRWGHSVARATGAVNNRR